jgi:hypothetical protein
VEQIVVKTDGVPLFVEELTKMVLESGLVKEEAERYELTAPLPPLAIPSTLQDSLMARLDRLATVKEVAQLGATLGRVFPYRLLRAVSTLEDAALRRDLAKLIDAELLYQRGLQPEATYVFKHALVQEAAYQSLLKSRRQQYHQRIAQVMVEQFSEDAESRPEFVAHHFTEAALPLAAARYWLRAGEQAIARSAHAEALAHLDRGLLVLAQAAGGAERNRLEAALEIAKGSAAIATLGYTAGEVGRAFGRARECAEGANDAELDVLAHTGLWIFRLVTGDLDAARATAEHCVTVSKHLSPELMIQSNLCMSCNAFWMGKLGEARAWCQDALVRLDQRTQHGPFFWLYHDVGVAVRVWLEMSLWSLGFPNQSLALCDATLSLSEALAHPLSRAHALAHVTFLHILLRDWAAAERFAAARSQLSVSKAFSSGVDLDHPSWSRAVSSRRTRDGAHSRTRRRGVFERRRRARRFALFSGGSGRTAPVRRQSGRGVESNRASSRDRVHHQQPLGFESATLCQGRSTPRKGGLAGRGGLLPGLHPDGAQPEGEIMGAAHGNPVRVPDERSGPSG